MKILYLAAECKPFSKAGGVGDVAGELPPALKKEGLDVSVVTPLYGQIDRKWIGRESMNYRLSFHGQEEEVQVFEGRLDDVPVYFIANKTYFEGRYREIYIDSKEIAYYDDALRFSFFSAACLPLIDRLAPGIVHINDWLLGYLAGYLRLEKKAPKIVLTIHNIGYQGNIGISTIKDWDMARILKDPVMGASFLDPRPAWQSVNPLRLAIELAGKVNTVSPTYCREITQPEDRERFFEGGKGLDGIARHKVEQGNLTGILNGFNYSFAPSQEKWAETLAEKARLKDILSADFSRSGGFLLGLVGRAVEQKLQLLKEEIDGKSVLAHILDMENVRLEVVATGQPEYESFLKSFSGRKNFTAVIAFDREKARQISLGCDVFLMPSKYEPCGITQFESMSYATPALVRLTGGLKDTVIPHTEENGTGFGFDGATRSEVLRNLIGAVREARDFYFGQPQAFRALQERAFAQRFPWADSVQRYINDLYLPLVRSS